MGDLATAVVPKVASVRMVEARPFLALILRLSASPFFKASSSMSSGVGIGGAGGGKAAAFLEPPPVILLFSFIYSSSASGLISIN
jgi:hypothetical protein